MHREKEAVLIVEDDGEGFDSGSLQTQQVGGIGLVGMKERTQLAGGKIDIISAKGEGTTIRVVVPVISDNEAN